MNQIDYERQKLKIMEMELEVEKQRLELMKLEETPKKPKVTSKPTLKDINFCKTNSKPYTVSNVTKNGVLYTETGYRLKINIVELIKLQQQLPSLLKKRNTPRFWEILGKKYNVSANCIERIVYNLCKGNFDDIINKWNENYFHFNKYGEIIGGN